MQRLLLLLAACAGLLSASACTGAPVGSVRGGDDPGSATAAPAAAERGGTLAGEMPGARRAGDASYEPESGTFPAEVPVPELMPLPEASHLSRVTMRVPGMTCPLKCVREVRGALAGLAWVEKIVVDPHIRAAAVYVRWADYDADDLVQALEDAGYRAYILEES